VLTLGPRSCAARRRSLSEVLSVCCSGSEAVDMSTSKLLSSASRSRLWRVGASELCRGVGEVVYAWRLLSFRKEGVVPWDGGSWGSKVQA
jgi:hypothetical protein